MIKKVLVMLGVTTALILFSKTNVFAYDLKGDINTISKQKSVRQVEITKILQNQNSNPITPNTPKDDTPVTPPTNNGGTTTPTDSGKTTIPNNNTGQNTTDKVQKLIEVLNAQVGKPYKWATNGPDTFDCSGLVQYSFSQISVQLPRTVNELLTVGTEVKRSDLKAGDILFFKDTENKEITHTAVYIGNNEFIHAPKTSKNVSKETLTSYYDTHFATARRVLN